MSRIDCISRAVMTVETTTREHKKRLTQSDRKLLMICCEALQQGRGHLLADQKIQIRELIEKLTQENDHKVKKKSNCIVQFVRRIFKGLGNFFHLRVNTKKLEKSIHQSSQRFFSNPVFKEMISTVIATKGLHPQQRKVVLRIMEQFALLSYHAASLQLIFRKGLENRQAIDYLQTHTGYRVENINAETLEIIQKAPELLIAKYLEAKERHSLQNFFEQAFEKKRSLNECYARLLNFNKPADENNEEIEQNEILQQAKVLQQPEILQQPNVLQQPEIVLKDDSKTVSKEKVQNSILETSVESFFQKTAKYKYEPDEYKEKSFNEIKIEADKGDCSAQYVIGMGYREGDGVSRSLVEALKYYELAANQGDIRAQIDCGDIYIRGGIGVPQSYEKAFKYYKLAADQKDAKYQYEISVMYAEGKGVPKNDEESLKYCKLAAKQDYYTASYKLAHMYFNGNGVVQSNKKALKYLKKAANKSAKAGYELGIIYEEGKIVEKSAKKAFKYFKTAYIHPEAQYKLGYYYENGIGTPKSEEDAFKCYMMASEVDPDHVNSNYKVGLCYLNGIGVLQSNEKGLAYLRFAEEKGHAEAAFILGKIAEEQQKDYFFLYYKKAANQKHLQASLKLGLMYEKGIGVEKSDEKAFEYLKIAADQNDKEAQFTLGTMYEKGQGVVQSKVEALKFYKLAADQGYVLAQEHVNRLQNSI